MADTTQQMRASGFAGLLGLFAGLCVIFIGCVTLADWHDEATQARWPVVSAMVDRAEVVTTERSESGTLWNLSAQVRYAVKGAARTATLRSRTAFSEYQAAKLEAWAEQHRNGGEVDIRYDPSRETHAVFASAELSSVAGRTGTDLTLLAIATGACVALLALARVLRRREARAAPMADAGQRRQPVLGAVVAAMGLFVAGSGVYGAIHADPFSADRLIAVPAGLMFVFAGLLIGLLQDSRWRDPLVTLLIICFALTFNWVAFGPGEREFDGSMLGFGFIPSEWIGRAVFGAFAILLDALVIARLTGRISRAGSRA
jgi:Protein of unknown function (DUF3592)